MISSKKLLGLIIISALMMFILIHAMPDTPISTPAPTAVSTEAPENLGDVNDDGAINIVDALITAQYYVGLNPSGFNTDAADTNCDGSINIVDALLIAQYYVGLISEFC
jgi:hypothetical protein